MRLAGVLIGFCGLIACGDRGNDVSNQANQAASVQATAGQTCASTDTISGLKRRLFDNARAIAGANAAALGELERGTVMRIMGPVVDQDDAALRRTLCSGRLVLEIPPGSETGFGGERQISVQVRYSSQLAADGSGAVYDIFGAEPLALQLARATQQKDGYRFRWCSGCDRRGRPQYLRAVDIPSKLSLCGRQYEC